MPKGEGRLRHPAVVLVGGAGPVDRDETVAGHPDLRAAGRRAGRARLHGPALRQARRRAERRPHRDRHARRTTPTTSWRSSSGWRSATTWIRGGSRSLGYGEGGSAAMLAAAREKKIARSCWSRRTGSTGADLVLEQQRHQLDLMKIPDAERQAEDRPAAEGAGRRASTDKGWEGIPPDVRKQADTPWFRSLLAVRSSQGRCRRSSSRS